MGWFRRSKTYFSFFMAGVMIVTGLPLHTRQIKAEETTTYTITNPRVAENGPTTWDCVWFGHYWQNDTNGVDKANREDDMEPIKWRVLEVDEEEILLVSDKILDVMQYDTTGKSASWEKSMMRSWLNGYNADENYSGMDYSEENFLDMAFTLEEQGYIADSDVVNENNPVYKTMAGKDTTDKVFLLSVEEITNPKYGFLSECESKTSRRMAENTYFTYYGGTIENEKKYNTFISSSESNAYWWLRSPGRSSSYAIWVKQNGIVDVEGIGKSSDIIGVRPAIRIKRDVLEQGLCTYAGVKGSDEDWYQYAEDGTEKEVTDPEIVDDVKMTKWDCIWFGNYWKCDTNQDGIADKNDEKEPILWRVLENDGGNLLLLADQNLDAVQYNESKSEVTWETCTLRSWLNGYDASANLEGSDYTNDNFYNNAFSFEEQQGIKETELVNRNEDEDVDGGNDTLDRIFCLSHEDILFWGYGLIRGYGQRTATNTAYTADFQYEGEKTMNECGWRNEWWLRTITSDYINAVTIKENGDVWDYGRFVSNDSVAVRPALYLDVSKVDKSLWSYAGTVTRYNGGEEREVNEPDAIPTVIVPTATPSPTPAASSEPIVESPSPTPTASNEPIVESPSPTPTASSEPIVESPSPTPTASSEPIVESPSPTPTASSEPIVESPSPTPTASSEPIVESPSPTPTASVKPIVESPSSTPTASSTPVQSPMVISDSLIPIVDDENLDGKIVSVKINKNNAPVIKWQKNSYATGYQIYRSRKKASGYLLIKEINSQQSFQFVDKKTSGNKKYYYRVRCFQDKDQAMLHLPDE